MPTALDGLGPALRLLRKARGLRQTDLGDIAQVRPATISDAETGVTEWPSTELLNKLLTAMDATVYHLADALHEVQTGEKPQKEPSAPIAPTDVERAVYSAMARLLSSALPAIEQEYATSRLGAVIDRNREGDRAAR